MHLLSRSSKFSLYLFHSTCRVGMDTNKIIVLEKSKTYSETAI
jgi:hypothetical protein